MKKFLEEFKTFALKGNVLDLAIGVIMGGAFGKIVTSVVNDLITPILSILIGGVNFTSLMISLPVPEGREPVNLMIGNFLQATLDFLIIAVCIFMFVKFLNRLQKVKQAPTAPPAPPEPTESEKLLKDIRDLLKAQQR